PHSIPSLILFYFLMLHRPPTYTLFPYTTLFRSKVRRAGRRQLPHDHQPGHVRSGEGPWGQERQTGQFPLIHSLTPRAFARSYMADRKSTRLNSSHLGISYAVFCLKKKKKNTPKT